MHATVQTARSSADLAESCADEAREEHPPDGLIRVRVREVRELADHLPVHDRAKRAKLPRHLAVVTERDKHLPRHRRQPGCRRVQYKYAEAASSTASGARRSSHGGCRTARHGPGWLPFGRHLLHVCDDLPWLDRGRALVKADVLRSLWQRVQLECALGEQRKLLLRTRASSTPTQARRTHKHKHTHTHTHTHTRTHAPTHTHTHAHTERIGPRATGRAAPSLNGPRQLAHSAV